MIRCFRQYAGFGQTVSYRLGRQLTGPGNELLALHFDTHGRNLGFEERLELLDDDDTVHAFAESADRSSRRRIGTGELEDAGLR